MNVDTLVYAQKSVLQRPQFHFVEAILWQIWLYYLHGMLPAVLFRFVKIACWWHSLAHIPENLQLHNVHAK